MLMVEGGSLLKQTLLEKTIEHVAWRGMRNLTMRAVSAEAGGTTAAIVHHYGSKSGLIASALGAAIEHEEKWHADLSRKIKGHRVGHLNFVEWIAQYIVKRSNNADARFWSEILFHTTIVPEAVPALRNWHSMRVNFLSGILEDQGCDPSFGVYLATYLCMEETWSQSLSEFAEYPILLRETIRALTTRMFGQSWTETDSVSGWLEERLDRFSLQPPQNSDTMGERLLTIAAQDILASGVKLNQRRITELAGASPSMIAYHFESLSAFRNQAVWRAMLRPFEDPRNPYDLSRTARDVEDWSALMADIIMPAGENKHSGSYASFARTIGEIALLSHRQPEMRSLAEHLRILDGTASFQASKTIWKSVMRLQRGQASAFAMWTKGQAVLSGALGYDKAFNQDAFRGAATLLI